MYRILQKKLWIGLKMRGVILLYIIIGTFCLGMLVGAKLLQLSVQSYNDDINERFIKSYWKQKNEKK